jgi:hypothetical protein
MQEDIVEVWSKYVNDPVAFVEQFWPNVKLAPYQVAILESVRDNDETWVHSANEMGKTFVAALAAIWWFATRKSKVVTSSTSEQQLKNVLWSEIDHLLSTATVNRKRFGFDFRRTVQRVELGVNADKKYYIIALVAEHVESFQGHHLPKLADGTPTVLFLFEEASGLRDEFYKAATSQAHSILAIGNPLTTSCVFYEKCRFGDQAHPTVPSRLSRKVIHVSGEHSPNVQLGRELEAQGRLAEYRPVIRGILDYNEFLKRQRDWRPYEVRTRLLGLFPDEGDQRLFPTDWLDLAQALGRKRREFEARRKAREFLRLFCALGIDVGQGGDPSVWCVFDRFGVRYLLSKQTPNTIEIAGQTIRLMRQFHICDYAVAFDSGGGGKQIADMLRDKGYDQIMDLEFGSAADEPKEYKNRRAELYGELRKALEPTDARRRLLDLDVSEWREAGMRCLALPPDDAMLREDLAVLPLLRDGEGRLRLPPKDSRLKSSERREPTVRELLKGRSPDRGDALAMALYAWRAGRDFRAAHRVPRDRPLIW